MSNEIARPTSSALSNIQTSAASLPQIGGIPFGKFKQGNYVWGRDEEAVPDGAYVVNTLTLAEGYTFWSDSKPLDEILIPLASGKPKPNKNELPAAGPIHDPGKDGWQELRSVQLKHFDSDFEMLLQGGSVGLIKAFNKLAMKVSDQIGIEDSKDEIKKRVYPIVELDYYTYKHPVHKNNIASPDFVIVDWFSQHDLDTGKKPKARANGAVKASL